MPTATLRNILKAAVDADAECNEDLDTDARLDQLLNELAL